MIERLKIENFKVFKEVEFPLHPLTVIVGPNASGKSSILQALDCCLVSSGRFLPPMQPFHRYGADGPVALTSHVANYSWRHESDASGREVTTTMLDGQPTASSVPVTLSKAFNGRRLRFEPLKLAAPSYPKKPPPRLEEDGSGLASVVANLQLENRKRFSGIVEQLHSVVDCLQDVRTRSATVELLEFEEGRYVPRSYTGFELLFDMTGAEGVPAAQVSEGTLLTLGLLTLINAPEPPNVLLIDDIERGLHPRAMGELIGQLRKLQEQNPDLQIVATTHSPLLVDYLKPEEVLLTALNDDGSATVAPLTEHPDFERWKDVMEPGEFWSTVGEKWITERKASKP
jgi:predicted ATPase